MRFQAFATHLADVGRSTYKALYEGGGGGPASGVGAGADFQEDQEALMAGVFGDQGGGVLQEEGYATYYETWRLKRIHPATYRLKT